jgi:hypothetical protein
MTSASQALGEETTMRALVLERLRELFLRDIDPSTSHHAPAGLLKTT